MQTKSVITQIADRFYWEEDADFQPIALYVDESGKVISFDTPPGCVLPQPHIGASLSANQPAWVQALDAPFRKVVKEKQSIRLKLVLPSVEPTPLKAAAIFLKAPQGLWSICLEFEKTLVSGSDLPGQIPDQSLSALMEHTPNAIFIVNNSGIICRTNPAFNHLLGFDALGYSPHECLQGWDDPAQFKRFSFFDLFYQERPYEQRQVLIGPSGRELMVKSKFVPIENRNGNPSRLAVILIDLTEEQERQSELLKLGKQLHLLVENTEENIVQLDRNRRLTFFNSAFARTLYSLCNRTPQLGEDPFSYFTWPACEEHAKIAHTLDQALSGQSIPDVRIMLRAIQGIVFSVSVTPVQEPEGEVSGVVIIGRNVTEMHNAELALKETERRFRLVTDYHLSGLFLLNQEKQLIWSNQRCAELMGVTRADLLGDAYRQVIPELWEMAQAARAPEYAILTRSYPGGMTRYLKLSFAATPSPDGEAPRFLGGLEDITELHQTRFDSDQFFDLAQDLILKLDTDGNILAANPAARALLGLTDSQSMNIRDYVHPEDLPNPDQRALLSQSRTRIEYLSRLRTFEGEYCWIDWAATFDSDTGVFYAYGRDITLSRREHQRLKLLESVVTHSSDGILTIQPDQNRPGKHKVTYANSAIASLSGMTLDELQDADPTILIDDIDVSLAQLLTRSVDHSVSINAEVSSRRPDGSQFWADVFIFPVKNDHDEVDHIAVIAHDITFCKQYLQEMRRIESYQRTILENSIQSIILIGLDNKVLVFNQKCEQEFLRSYGIRPKVGGDLQDFVSKESYETVNRFKQAVLEQGFLETVIRKEDVPGRPEWRQFYATQATDDRGEVFGIIISSNDISELHQASEELKIMTNRLELALRSAGVGIWELDMKTYEFFGDETSRIFYQFTPEHGRLNIQTWLNFVYPDDIAGVVSLFGEMQAGLQEVSHTFRIVRTDGEVRYLEMMAAYFQNDNDAPGRYIGVNRDVTEEELARQELLRTKELAEEMTRLKTNFLANMSHEIRTPMNGIMGLMELLGEEQDPEQRALFVDMMQKSGRRLLSTLTGILELSRMEAEKTEYALQVVKVCQLVQSVFESLTPTAVTKGIEFQLHEGPEVYVLGDERMLDQVLTNIVGNALKFTLKGNVRVTWERMVCKRNQKMIAICVSDSGIGMNPDQIEKIFQPFQQVSQGRDRRFEGAGLGLAIAKKYTELLGGSITVDTQLERGSTFRIVLPEYFLS